MNSKTKKLATSKRNIALLEIELIFILAVVLLLGMLFGYALAANQKVEQSKMDPSGSFQTMDLGVGTEDNLF